MKGVKLWRMSLISPKPCWESRYVPNDGMHLGHRFQTHHTSVNNELVSRTTGQPGPGQLDVVIFFLTWIRWVACFPLGGFWDIEQKWTQSFITSQLLQSDSFSDSISFVQTDHALNLRLYTEESYGEWLQNKRSTQPHITQLWQGSAEKWKLDTVALRRHGWVLGLNLMFVVWWYR